MVFASKSNGGVDDAVNKAPAEKRDPFWPVGYRPEKVINETTPTDTQPAAVDLEGDENWSEAMSKVAINGISSRSDSEFYAVVNGRVKSIGDTVSVNLNGLVYTWAVERIQPPNSVKLRRLSVK
jgi:hypothetical protein